MARRHLSWKLPIANNADKVQHGTVLRGERSVTAKLTEKQAREAHVMKAGGYRAADIAGHFRVSIWTIHDLLSGRTWGWLHPTKVAG